jgi:hypothetical protein
VIYSYREGGRRIIVTHVNWLVGCVVTAVTL